MSQAMIHSNLRQEKNKTHKQHPDDSQFVQQNLFKVSILGKIDLLFYFSYLNIFVLIGRFSDSLAITNEKISSRVKSMRKMRNSCFSLNSAFCFFFFFFDLAVWSVWMCLGVRVSRVCECNNFFFHCSHQYYFAYVQSVALCVSLLCCFGLFFSSFIYCWIYQLRLHTSHNKWVRKKAVERHTNCIECVRNVRQ